VPLYLEPLTNGLVTARDATLLDPGELTLATNGIYRPFNQALSPIKGRQQFGDAIGANIYAFRATPLEGDGANTTRVIVGHGTVWQYGTGGAWTTFRTSVNPFRFEAVSFENAYYIGNGSDTPLVFFGTASTIPHGMTRTEDDDFTVANVAGGGLWDQDGQAEQGFYSWWITEYDSVHDIESALSGDGDMAFVLADTNTIRISIQYGTGAYPTLHNSNADTWRVYRSARVTGVNPDSAYPTGFLVGSVAVPGAPAVTTFDDVGNISDTPYAILSLSIAGSPAILIERDTPPPLWNTGDIFEDSLVVNDTTEPSLVRYSFPGKPHSFPSLYFIGFNTKQQDVVTCIKSLDAVCVVGLRTQLWRLNYLPNETDSEFSRGRCRELISANHGIIGADAACIFTPVEGASRIAYVSHDGLYMTDGIRTQLLTMDLDWDALVSKTDLPNCLLVNAQHLWCLFFYYTSAGGSAPNDRLLTLSYHPQHLKESGYLKIAGPTAVAARAADYASNSFRSFATDTQVREEDVVAGSTILAAQTRLIYPDQEIDTESHVSRVRILTGAASSGTFTAALRRRRSDADIVTETSKAYTPSTTENRLVTLDLHTNAEAFGALINSSADLLYIAFEHATGKGK
jgi:hypothetical protein